VLKRSHVAQFMEQYPREYCRLDVASELNTPPLSGGHGINTTNGLTSMEEVRWGVNPVDYTDLREAKRNLSSGRKRHILAFDNISNPSELRKIGETIP